MCAGRYAFGPAVQVLQPADAGLPLRCSPSGAGPALDAGPLGAPPPTPLFRRVDEPHTAKGYKSDFDLLVIVNDK